MSKIEWTDETWNPVTGCTRVSAGCDNCYAARMTKRLAAMGQEKYQGLYGNGHFNGQIKLHEDALNRPLIWRKPRMVFVNSMSDLFHKDVPFEFIDKVFASMAVTPFHTFQVLTKRPERMAEYLVDAQNRVWEAMMQWDHFVQKNCPHRIWHVRQGKCWPLENVWLGTSVENQATADERIPPFRKCPAAVRFLSCEPLLESVDLFPLMNIDWIIIGGESGHNARKCDIDWIRGLLRQCRTNDIPCFVKQLGARPYDSTFQTGEMRHVKDKIDGKHNLIVLNSIKGGDPDEWPEDLRVREFPEVKVPPCQT